MSVVELLSSLAKKDIRLWLEGENLRFSAPEGAFTPEIRDEIVAAKPQIIEFLKQAQKLKKKGIDVASREGDLPVSYSQQRLWLLDQINPNDTTYNIPAAFRIKGQIDPKLLEKAFASLVERHESLRTTFSDVEGSPIQVIEPFTQWQLPLEDITSLSDAEKDQRLIDEVNKEAQTPFSLNEGPLFRARLLILKQDGASSEFALIACMHHVISDAWSMDVLVKEMAAFYMAAATGTKAALEPLPIQYADYAVWQRNYLEDDAFKEDLKYWQEQLADAPPVLDIPTDYPRPELLRSHGATYRFEFTPALSAKVNEFCKTQDLTPFMVSLGAWQLLLGKYANSHDVVVGAPVAGRDRHETQELIGFFVNMLLFRLPLNDRPSVADFFKRVKEMVLGGFNHQEVPIDILLENMDVERQPGYPPLAQAAFQLLVQESGTNNGQPAFGAGPLEIQPIPNANVSARMDLTLGVVKTDQGFEGGLEYNTDLFNESTISHLIDQYQFLIGELVSDQSKVIDDIALFDDEFLLSHMGLDIAEFQLEPLNDNQRVMLIDQQAHPDTKQNAYGIYARLPADIDLACLTRAIQAVSDASPMLRATLKHCDVPAADDVYFVVPKTKTIELNQHSVVGMTADQQQLAIDDLMHKSFDIFKDDLIHYHWVQCSDKEGVLILGCHHMVLDGASTFAQMSAVLDCYRAYQAGEAKDVAVDLDYASYRQWEKANGSTPAILDFWRQQLQSTEALNFSKPREGLYPIPANTASRIHDNAINKLVLDKQTTNSLREFCGQSQLTLPAYFRTLYGMALLNYCRAEDSFSVFDFYGNRREVSPRALGCFYQQHPAIFDKSLFDGNTPIVDWFSTAKSFNDLVKDKRVIDIATQRAMASLGPVLFMYNFYNFTTDETVDGMSVVPYMSAPRVENGVQFIIRDAGDNVELELRYDPRVFEDCHFLQRVQHISEQIVSGEASTVSELEFLSAGEKAKLHQWSFSENAADETESVAIDKENVATIVDWFQQQAQNIPDRVALIQGDTSLSYQALDERSNQLAHWLRSQGVAENVRVGLCFDRSIEFVVAVWGVLKAGGAYVPMDAGYPADRLAYIVEDSAAPVILTQQKVASVLPATSATVCVIDTAADIKEQSSKALETCPTGKDQIYAIYTSGSTGQPKGALVTHQGEINLQRWYLDALSVDETSTNLLVSAIGFDLTQKNIFATLLKGGKLVIPEMDLYDEQLLVNTIQQHQVTIVNCAPSAFYPLVQASAKNNFKAIASLKHVVLGGEPIQLSLLHEWLGSDNSIAQLVNSYGPTECTDVVSYHGLDIIEAGQSFIPIGQPIAGVQLLVLNENLQQVIPGLVGELCIGGGSVGLGYINKPELTDSVFLDNPFGEGKLYRTGDLVRYLANGELEYIGRKDFQIKLRGLRIELGEIETALKSLADVKDGLVLLKNDQLIGYVVTNEGQDIIGWRDALRASLPDYMVPSGLVVLSAWPLTPNGKVDRKALPDPDTANEQSYVAPRNDVESQLAQIWQQVLERDQIGVLDNLFDIGGNSLLATRILSRVRRAFGVDVSVRELFQAPNVAGLAKAVHRSQRIGDIPSLQAQERGEKIPLSFAQQRLWLLDQLDPGNTAYNMPAAVRLSGDVQPKLLESVFNEIIRRHEVFRTQFKVVDDEPVQVIQEHVEFELCIEDLSQHEASEAESLVENRVISEASAPFDLENGPLLKALLLKLSDHEYVLIANKHHIISDGWSMGVLMQEIATLYDAFLNAKPSPLPDLAVQYADFAIWQRGWLQGQVLDTQIDYWKEKLADAPVLELATDFPRPNKPDQRGAVVEFSLSEKLTQQIEQLSQQNSSTAYITLLAAFQVLLYRYTNQRDIVVGSPIANRNWSELEPIIGFFVNTLAFRNQLDPNGSFKDFLYQVEQGALEAYDHQDIPFERLVDELGVERSLTHTPVFQVLFTYQNISEPTELTLKGLTLTPVEAEANDAKFDLMLNMGINQGRLSGVFGYRVALYKAETIERLVAHFQRLLEAIVAEPELPLSQLAMLDHNEIEQQLQAWNQTEVSYDQSATMQTLIDQQCLSTPDSIAIKCGRKALSYGDLQAQANTIANYLIEKGVQPNDKVGLCFDRHMLLMPSILGILKAGGTYVPLDASYPEGRIRYIVEDANIQWVVSRTEVIEQFPQGEWQCLAMDTVVSNNSEQISNVCIAPDSERLLYMIYTSGSTGRPKGTGAFQKAEVNLQQWYARDYGLNQQDNVMLMSALGFDLTQKNLFAPLINGACLVIPDFQEFDPQLLLATIHEHQVTWINCAPSAFYPLTDDQQDWHKLETLKHLFLGGEPINLPRLKAWLTFSGCKLVNSYGPTECTDIATAYTVELSQDLHYPVLPIGRAIDNVRLYILGDANELMPVGGAGELCIGGDSVGPGYLNNQELTDKVFFQNPFASEKDTLYRTGDLVRYREDGNIEYLGRRDHQIKLRGFRIEVEEIKAVINEFDGVTDSLVAVEKTEAGEMLFAWVVNAESGDTNDQWLDQLKQHAANLLASHMMPNVWFVLDQFPLTPNGKVDRKALPKTVELDTANARLPETTTELAVAAVWQDILGIESVGADQDFFQLGGHSLLATQVVSRLKKQYGVDIPIRKLFESPTVTTVARVIDELVAAGDQSNVPDLTVVDRSGSLPLSFVQQQLWLLDQLDPGSAAYNMPVVLELTGDLDVEVLNQSISNVVARHETLRSNFVTQNDEPSVVIHAAKQWQINVVDVSDKTGDAQANAIHGFVEKETNTGFDLVNHALMRTTLLKCHQDQQSQRWVFVAVMHHIISDGWSMDVLVQELATSYIALKAGQQVSLPALEYQYVDYAAWQRNWLQGEELEKQITYWRNELDNEFAVLDLPTDFPRPTVQTINGSYEKSLIDIATVESLAAVAKQEGATLFMALLATFKLLLHRYSGQQGFNVGIPIAGRVREEVEPMIGMFINTAVISTQFESVNSYRDLLQQIKDKSLGAFGHQSLPFEKIVEELKPKRDLSRTPYFQVFFNLLNLPETHQDVSGLTISPMFGEDHETHAKFDLNMYAKETPQGVQLQLVYNTDLFKAETIQTLLEHFNGLIKEVIASPDSSLLDFKLASKDQVDRRPDPLTSLSKKSWPNPLQNLAKHAHDRGSELAIKDSQSSLTFAELEHTSNVLAKRLLDNQVTTTDTVAVYAYRNAGLVVSLLAILKTGASFTVYDAAYPIERIRHYQKLSNTKVVIDVASQPSEGLGALIESENLTAIQCDLSELANDSASALEIPDSDQKAYIAYTSGTTGEPKAIVGTLAPIAHFIDWYAQAFNLGASDRFTMLSGLAHDPLLRDIFTPLSLGASLHIPDAAWYADPQTLTEWLVQEQVTVMHLTPALSQLITGVADWQGEDPVPEQYLLSDLRYAVFGGDKLTATAVNGMAAYAPKVESINFYGATETPQAMSFYRVPSLQDAHASQWVPVGTGIDASQLLILNEQGSLAEVGEVGEIVIRSPYLSQGYLNIEEDSPFRLNPISQAENDTVYYTGDKGRYLPDGKVHLIGRIDQQIKIRGYRVEPAEVQHEINQLNGVKTSVVVDALDQRGDICLNAYVVLHEGIDALDREAVRQTLIKNLPDYMVPSGFTVIEEIPLTPNGKLNKAALPDPTSQVNEQEYVAPETEVEAEIAEIWQTILKVEQVGINDDFFALGGHSLLATQIVSRVREKYNVEFPLRALFQSSTVKGMANYIETTLWARGEGVTDNEVDEDDDMEEFEI
ncbi:MAG: amino acid adenylation domain-containing protein [Pseudomonadales bacterium]|nr:amino acid adenylation domain-containing protein [Pseudomonadales bacterium]